MSLTLRQNSTFVSGDDNGTSAALRSTVIHDSPAVVVVDADTTTTTTPSTTTTPTAVKSAPTPQDIASSPTRPRRRVSHQSRPTTPRRGVNINLNLNLSISNSRVDAVATACDSIVTNATTNTLLGRVLSSKKSSSSALKALPASSASPASLLVPSNQTATKPTTGFAKLLSVRALGRPPRFRKLHKQQLHNNSKINKMTNGIMTHGGPPENVVQWLEASCPQDVVPHVLAYCGPQMTATLMATNRYWFDLIAKNDGTWRVLSQGMYKWNEEEDDLPSTSWKEYYRMNPCVPTDYSTIPKALALAYPNVKKPSGNPYYVQYLRSSSFGSDANNNNNYNNNIGDTSTTTTTTTVVTTTTTTTTTTTATTSNQISKKKDQVRNIRILLRPGKHYVKESLVVSASEGVTVSLETMKLPEHRFYSPRLALAEQHQTPNRPEPTTKSRSKSIRKLVTTTMGGCRSVSSVIAGGDTSTDHDEEQDVTGETDVNMYDSDASELSMRYLSDNNNNMNLTGNTTRIAAAPHRASMSNIPSSSVFLADQPKYPVRAKLVLKTRRQNEPIIRVRQGNFRLARVDLDHASNGVDIWNGNAAVQVQPPMGNDNQTPLPIICRPTAQLDHVSISSRSGRGLVCLDGGHVTLRRCMIFDCAATGLYIGGPGSEADMSSTDIIRNGIGCRLPPSRAPRVTSGHSGVYLEQGIARIQECNISSNCLTGISAVSPDNAVLHLSKSDLVANGQCNMEMPAPGTPAHDQSNVAKDNNLASVGRPCLRSNLELPARARAHVRASF